MVNGDLDKSFAPLARDPDAERLKRVHRPDLETFVAKLLADLNGRPSAAAHRRLG